MDYPETHVAKPLRMVRVVKTDRPPMRLEGGGINIVDILSAFEYPEIDPFLIYPKNARVREAVI